jgi:hypothetical protein
MVKNRYPEDRCDGYPAPLCGLAHRMSWFGHIHRVTKERMVKKLYEWKQISTRLAGRPKIIWEKDIKDYLRPMKINNGTKCIQVWVKWKEAFEKAKTFNQ